MARKEYDSLTREIADATKKDFYWVERMFASMIKNVMTDELEKYQTEIETLKNEVIELKSKIENLVRYNNLYEEDNE